LLSLYIIKCLDDRDVNLDLIDYLGDKLVPNDFKQKIEIEIKGLKRIEKANKLTKNQRRRVLDLRKYEFAKFRNYMVILSIFTNMAKLG
jgi:hypothetical protein